MTIRCATFGKMSEADKRKIDRLFDEIEEKPHTHVWCDWLVSKTKFFRKCIDCGEIETRPRARRAEKERE